MNSCRSSQSVKWGIAKTGWIAAQLKEHAKVEAYTTEFGVFSTNQCRTYQTNNQRYLKNAATDCGSLSQLFVIVIKSP